MATESPPTLICTLGGSWGVVPEVLGYLSPGQFPVYPHDWFVSAPPSPRVRLAEVVCITTAEGAERAAPLLFDYWSSLPPDLPPLRILHPEGVADISSRRDNDLMEELVCRVALEKFRRGHPLYWSLAGGRKTMSSLLQRAAGIFGAADLIHVASSAGFDRAAAAGGAGFFREGIPPELAGEITVISLGGYSPADWLDWGPPHGVVRLEPADYPVLPDGTGSHGVPLTDAPLVEELRRREREAENIARGYFYQILSDDHRENFRALYRLPPSVVERLKTERVGLDPGAVDHDLGWLRRLPKAELHCHLGGALRPEDLPEVARAVVEDGRRGISPSVERFADDLLRELPPRPAGDERDRPCIASLRERLLTLDRCCRHLVTARLIASLSPQWLERLTRVDTEGLPTSKERLDAYQSAGFLQGSSLLTSPAAIERTCHILYRTMLADNVRYLEVRCSPANYATERLSPVDILSLVRQSFAAARRLYGDGCRVELIVIGTRHGDERLFKEHVRLAADPSIRGWDAPGVVGFDVAGSESTRAPRELRDLFEDVFRQCVRITIHAGETEPAENIWEAVYHLNAERIGHGLRLRDHPELLAHVRDRGVAVELCPTSNRQIVGFRNPRDQAGQPPPYPLKSYLHEGVRIAVCTDNPGISRTTPSRELLEGALLTEGGLSKWEILLLVRGGFQSAFLPQPERARLLKEVDREVYDLMGEGSVGGHG